MAANPKRELWPKPMPCNAQLVKKADDLVGCVEGSREEAELADAGNGLVARGNQAPVKRPTLIVSVLQEVPR
jgi:hypothetical protein